MYSITCDNYTLYDHRDPDLVVGNPKCKLEVNTVGEASFTIHQSHPYYSALKPLKSVFEISDEIGVIFRGRMTNNSLDFYNSKAVDLEGSMAFFNDSIVRPFTFPDDFFSDADYVAAEESGNVVEFFLKWLIDNHNSQVLDVQKFKLGKVTVADPNNYITRSNEKYDTTWNTLKSKLFDSGLGGYLCIRYEADGNYIDYVSEFELTNTQEITFGENLLDLKSKFDASNTFNAMIPVGATVEADGVITTVTITDLVDETIAGDIVKDGDMIYSISAVENYGSKIFASPSESTWDDVTEATNLLNKAIEKLTGQGQMLSNNVEFTAVDLHFTDSEVRSFRIYRNVIVNSAPHNQSDTYQLTRLDLDLFNPQNTKISVGKTTLTMTDTNNKNQANVTERIETVEKDIAENRNEITETRNTVLEQSTQILNNCESIILGALENYVETGNFDEYKETVKTQFELLAGEINMVFNTTTNQITDVNGDLQSKFNQLYKHIQFTGEDGITISMGSGKMALQLDNDIISFTKDGRQFGWWDGVNFHTGNIVVDVSKKAQFGNFAFVPRSDGSLSFVKVGG
ncbi:MAG: hypothetical protein J6Q39_08350 [Bacteroidales bacterium]|nr:hypothetical protein [Bacteroidales bacterium]